MMRCPTCGQSLPECGGDEAERLLGVLTNGMPQREVYITNDGEWFVTYGGGQFSADAVNWLATAKLITQKYSNCPGCYYVGRTIDMDASLALPKVKGKRQLVYVSDKTA